MTSTTYRDLPNNSVRYEWDRELTKAELQQLHPLHAETARARVEDAPLVIELHGATFEEVLEHERANHTNFTAAELNGKTVEFETADRGTARGTLKARQTPERINVEIEVAMQSDDGTEAAVPLSLHLGSLKRHPKPERAEFLWSAQAEVLVCCTADSAL